MTAYYNEIDPFAAQWLHNLIDAGHIAPGDVDTRSITEVQPDDIKNYTQVHLFAGLGGWSLALRLAGWPDDRPVWSGSCPCQPFSSAGKQKGQADERHLWPEMFRLITGQPCECRPPVVIGEQVSSAIGHGWLDGVCDDLEREGYACGSAVLGAFSLGAPHKRSRLYWVADAEHAIGRTQHEGDGKAHWRDGLGGGSNAVAQGDSILPRLEGHAGHGDLGDEPGRLGSLAAGPVAEAGGSCAMEHPAGDGRDARRAEPDGRGAAGGCCADGMGDADSKQTNTSIERQQMLGQRCDFGTRNRGGQEATHAWSDFTVVHCLDGKARRVGRGVFPLVDGLPRDMGRGQPELFRLARRARGNRTGRLKGYGNAIVPQVAAEFIRAVMEARP